MRIRVRMLAVWSAVGALTAGACATSATNPSSGDDDDENCAANETDCDGDCVDLGSDPANCGECGKGCTSGQCAAGSCVSPCGAGLIECGGSCIDPQTDTNNCGACGIACTAPLVCNGSVCSPPCPAGQTGCNGICTDLLNDEQNCGKCGTVCDAASACNDGICEALCQPGMSYCSNVCVDTETDEQNCGGCGAPCQFDQTCESGTCTDICGADETYCSSSCVDVTSNQMHCGMCNKACIVGQTCVSGVCQCDSGVCGGCGVTDLGNTVPQTANGNTTGGPDLLVGSCSPDPAPEAMFSFTAPNDGTFGFSTAGSTYDTVLAVLSSACAELACNDDFGADVTSQVSVAMTAGQTVHILVDGFLGDFGPFTLSVFEDIPVPCPETDLGSTVPQTVNGSTVGKPNTLVSGCGFGDDSEATYSFTAPVAGSYTFDTIGSSYDTLLDVKDATCAGAMLGCDDDGAGLQSTVTINLAQNQTVIVVVDGYDTGPYILNIKTP